MKVLSCVLLAALEFIAFGQEVPPVAPLTSAVIGQVWGPDGASIQAEITLYRLVIEDGIAKPAVTCIAETNAEGIYECEAQSPGKYLVFAKPAEGSGAPPDSRLPPMFFQNAMSVDQAALISLHPDDRQTANFVFRAADVITVYALLKDKPKVAHAALTLAGGTFDIDPALPISYDPSTGRLTAKAVPYGQYRLTATWLNGTKEHSGSMPIQVNQATPSDLAIIEDSMSDVAGSVSFSEGPISRLPDEISFDRVPASATGHFTSKVKADGSFGIPAMPSGSYYVHVPAADGAYVSAITVRGKSIDGSLVTLPDGLARTSMNVMLSGKAGSISGSVGREVALGPGKNYVLVQSTESKAVSLIPIDKEGQFKATALAPGEYRLFFWPNVRSLEYKNAVFLAVHAEEATLVSVDAGVVSSGVSLRALTSPDGAN